MLWRIKQTNMKKLILGVLVFTAFTACVKKNNPIEIQEAIADNTTANKSLVAKKFLFDATKAQTAGNADWILDANSGTISRFPTPAQSGITSTTSENYWQGANSYWGVDLVKQGHNVEQLPPGTAITYGSTSNPQDLSNYDVYIVVEPNIKYTTAEKTAILNFIQNGGGLFMISDHDISDRNNDGFDSPTIWNDLMSANPFGFKFDLANFSQTSSNRLSVTTNTILNGALGAVSSIKYSAGTSMTINSTTKAKGLIWKTGSSQSTTGLLALQATYGTGRIVAVGDSSPADDGTGQPGNNLFFGWTDLSGAHRKLHLNASLWLAKL
jgi:hypothetical protein